MKVGRGALVTKTLDEARALAQSLVQTGQRAGLRTEAVITAMDAPLGRAIGNALEVAEAIAALRGAGPADFMAVVTALAVRMLVCSGLADARRASARARVDRALASGDALERFRTIMSSQEGDPRVVDDPARLPQAPVVGARAVGSRRNGGGHRCPANRPRGDGAAGPAESRQPGGVDPAVGVVMRVVPGSA